MASNALNIYTLLEGREGTPIYSTLTGEETANWRLILQDFQPRRIIEVESYRYKRNGSYISTIPSAPCCLFPSRELYAKYPLDPQQAWMEWLGSQKPKTWEDLVRFHKVDNYMVDLMGNPDNLSAIDKSARALLKIHKLIEVAYGGTPSNNDWKKYIAVAIWVNANGKIQTGYVNYYKFSPILFRSKELAEEFLSHPSNIQLLKDFFMV